MGKDRFGLTLKQASFVDAYLYGEKTKGNATASYRKAYDCESMADSSIHVEACKLLSHPKVSQRIEDLSKEKEEKNRLQAVSKAEEVYNLLYLEGTTASSDSARVSALIALGKTIPQFFTPQVQEVTSKVQLSNAERDLEQAISQALADGTVTSLLSTKNKLSPNLRDKKSS